MTVLLALCLAVPALALAQSGDFYVTDETGSLSQETVEHVLEVNYDLEESCGGAQIVVAFINYFGDVGADEYAVGLFNDWQLSDRAMLLAVSPREGRGGLVVGTALDSRFTSRDMEDYLDRYFWDDFDDGKYDRAVTTLVDELAGWFYDEYNVAPPSQGASKSSGALAGLGIFGAVLGFLLRNIFLILIFVAIVAVIILADRRRYRGYYTSLGMPIPRYYPWYMFTSRPYRRYTPPPRPRPASRGPHGPGPDRHSPHGPAPTSRRSSRPSAPARRSGSAGSFGGRSSAPSRPSHPTTGGRSSGSFGGRR